MASAVSGSKGTATPAAAAQQPSALPVHPDDRVDDDTRVISFSTSYPYLVTPKKYRYIRWAAVISIISVFTVVVLSVLAWAQIKFKQRVNNRASGYYIDPPLAGCWDADSNLLPGANATVCSQSVIVEISPLKWDASSSILSVQYKMALGSFFLDTLGRYSQNDSFILDTLVTSKAVKKGERPVAFTVDIPIVVDVSNYPVEVYETGLFSLPLWTNTKNPTNLPTAVPQLAFIELRSMPTFEFDAPVLDAPQHGFKIKFRRSPVIKAIVLLTFFLMHMWVVIAAMLTGQVIFRERDAQPIMNWVASAVFSMGTIRAAQPLAPPIGTTADLVTYVYAILAISFSAFVAFVVNFRSHKPKTKDKDLEKREKKIKWRKFLKEEAEEAKKKAAAEAAANEETKKTGSTATLISEADANGNGAQVQPAAVPRPVTYQPAHGTEVATVTPPQAYNQHQVVPQLLVSSDAGPASLPVPTRLSSLERPASPDRPVPELVPPKRYQSAKVVL
ncbi:hypothetical protein HDU96_008033 [Phlyctochytrium bullatum]|nr:hypothetical protein HDU96_008033 [Phlyctochytrium bullatum]